MDRSQRTGIFIMMLAALFFSIGDICIKVLGGNLSSWQIAAGRGLLGLVGVLVLIRFRVRILLVGQWPWQLLLGVTGALGFIFFIISIKYLPLSIAIPLGYIYPAIGALLSPWINKEKPGRADWAAIGLAFAAVLCLSHGAPSDQEGGDGNVALGLTFGVLSAFWVGLMINLARRQSRRTVLSVNLFYMFLANFAVGLLLSLIFDESVLPPPADLGKLFFIIAPLSITSLLLMFMGYRYISAHRGGIVLTLEAAAAAVYGLAVLNEPVSLAVVLGGALILASGVIIIRSGAV